MAAFDLAIRNGTVVTAADTIRCDIGVRYWEDGVVNGMADNDDNPQMPLVKDGRWHIDIDLASGRIADWPANTLAEVHYKVCDDGVYSLLDDDGEVVAQKAGYVPGMLCPADNGYGDYVIMNIGPDGTILNWSADLDYFEGDA